MTFGRKGVSNGQYFNQHLQYIVLEDNPYNFTSADLSYLLQVIHCVLYLFICLLSWQRNYQRVFVDHVHGLPSETLTQIQQSQSKDEVVIRYSSNKDFTNLAKKFGLMSDLKVSFTIFYWERSIDQSRVHPFRMVFPEQLIKVLLVLWKMGEEST